MWSEDAYQQAWTFAAEAHRGQKVPGSHLPYLVHVAGVAMEVISALRHETVAAPDLAVQCALLHDTVEDTDVTVADLERRFGPAVAAGVAALSKRGDLPKAEAMGDSLARIAAQPHEVWMVKLADRITNLQPPPAHWTADKCAAYRREAQQIHAALAAASRHLARRLAARIEAYAAYCR
ncbi:MAG: bifunctional (p)ppGpp synthetase/guanosine-3',5'-bis(diphosphate) 3'-pyrophosphohydrolase [Hyphomicrobiales bacterium]|nr:bifunctional (p)ppGpp synthetase/guanosine-3',5'-bis(diphosphate) 3'-pyrophosphohydrolase [Hyphomicrobiales bacterium]MCP5372806.1 bifunctional (p)ppGpp synthetase/guanosine-3',5'-bis(diphosphate) 3'-pyrophosphohydrolase [Hyphomicrobiales bacterium]